MFLQVFNEDFSINVGINSFVFYDKGSKKSPII